MNRCQFIEPE